MEHVVEPARELPVSASYDVVVVGGGVAGVAAAVSAARAGASVLLLERLFALGGLATLGNVIVFLPLCDGRGTQVIGGIAEEMLKLSIRGERETHETMRVDAEIPACWRRRATKERRARQRYRVCFNPNRFLLELERWLGSNGVDWLYDTRFCRVIKRDDGFIETVVVENKDGRHAIRCGAVVDASGDADVCAAAGEAVESLATNTRSAWYYLVQDGDIHLVPLSKPFDAEAKAHPRGGRHYAGDKAADVTAHMVDSRRLLRRDLRRREKASETGTVFPILTPTLPCFRMTRRLRGRAELGPSDQGKWCDDAVAMTGDWRHAGPIYCIGLGHLAGVQTPNLVTAGRCISASGRAWDVVRAIPTCCVTGEAAGLAAARAIRATGGDIRRLDAEELRVELRDRGGIMDPEYLRGDA